MRVWLAWIFLAALASPASAQDEAPLRVHIISGSKEYKSGESLKAFKAHLEKSVNVTCTASWTSDGAKELEGLEALQKADVLVLFARRLKLGEKQMSIIRAHWEAGKPIVGIRTSSHAFQKEDNAVLDRKVMGGNYSGHFGDEAVKVTNAEDQADHPVLKGVKPFTSKKLYKMGEVAEGTVVLQRGDNGKSKQVVTIAHEYKGGRMVYTSLGVPDDFKDENFRRLLVNAIFWAARRPR